MSFAIGIDLGTSTSEICVYRNNEPYVIPDPHNPGKSPIVPSLVAVNPAGEICVGHAARQYVYKPGAGVREVKRKMGSGETVPMGGKDYRPEEISALILKKLKDVAEEALGAAVTDVVLSVPANFPDAARAATMAAGQMARLNVTRLINEPTAAALAFGIRNINADEQLVVFDFGGGTLDITVLEMTEGVLDVKSSFGDTQLGGKDFDEAMIQLLLQKFAAAHPRSEVSQTSLNQLKDKAEEVKIALSTQRSAMAHMANFGSLKGDPLDLDVMVTREEYERAVAPLLDRARACVRQALNAKQLKPSAIDRVLLVGGTTYVPCVRRLVAELFNKEPKADVNPDLAVATGAAIQAALAQGLLANAPAGVLTLVDVCPFGLGIPLLNAEETRMLYEPLIKPNTTIPFSVKQEYRLVRRDQTKVRIQLLQDHTGRARFPEDAVDTGIDGLISNIPPAADGLPHVLEVDFSYDLSGLARLTARIPATGQAVAIQFDKAAKRVSAADVAAGQEKVDDLWRANPQAARYEGLLAKARAALAAAGPTQARLAPAIAALEKALAGTDQAATDAAADALTDLLFDLENDVTP
jgi:molecular chaperone DnaK